jgi:hypothetical protein
LQQFFTEDEAGVMSVLETDAEDEPRLTLSVIDH